MGYRKQAYTETFPIWSAQLHILVYSPPWNYSDSLVWHVLQNIYYKALSMQHLR
ncbi:hypothetical protein RSAG8_07398, partial [Rhizoctonia solani AG-8 WAC10335]